MLNEKYVLLVKILNNLIKKYGNNTKVIEIVKEEFTKRNMLASHAVRLLTEKVSLETLQMSNQRDLFLLFSFTNALQKALSTLDDVKQDTLGTTEEYFNILPENYFTKIEVENFKEHILEKKEVSKYPYVFKNMIRVEEGHWTGIITAQYLEEINAANDIIYNFATQRDPKIDVFGLKKINIDIKKIQTIHKNLLEGKQRPDEIKLNVLRDGEDNVDFISKDGIIGDLYVYSGEIDIFDGYHRKTSNSLAINDNHELSFNWKIAVTNWSGKKAQGYMVQINEQKPINKEHTGNMDSSKIQNVVVDYIKDNSMSELAEQIKDSDAELKSSGLTKKSILSLAINECYEGYIQNKTQIKPIADWIVEFTNYLMGLHIEEFIEKPKEIAKVSYINHKNMFMGYVALSEKLYNQRDWQDRLKEIMSNIDFSIDAPFWKEIVLTNNELNKNSRDRLYSFFRRDV